MYYLHDEINRILEKRQPVRPKFGGYIEVPIVAVGERYVPINFLENPDGYDHVGNMLYSDDLDSDWQVFLPARGINDSGKHFFWPIEWRESAEYPINKIDYVGSKI